MDREVAVLAAVRTPTGKIPGELAYIEDTKLLAAVFRSAAKAADGFPIDMAVAVHSQWRKITCAERRL